MTTTYEEQRRLLDPREAETYAHWFGCLAEPTRVRLLHAVATSPDGLTVGELTSLLGIGQSTCSHHVQWLTKVGFVLVQKRGTTTVVTVNEACCTGLPQAADAVMGMLSAQPCCPEAPADVAVRALREEDWPTVLHIYGEGITTGNATFETEVPAQDYLEQRWLPDHRWVAEVDGQIAGWAAATAVSARDCYAGIAETSVYVGEGFRGRGVGKALLRQQVCAADDAGLWTLQTSIFPENKASLALHRQSGFRTIGLRERIAQHHGRWRDTVFLERRTAAYDTTDPTPEA